MISAIRRPSKRKAGAGPIAHVVLIIKEKAGYISRALHSHVSLLRFCETTFGLPTLNARDASADDMADCFDYSQRPAPPPFTAINA